MLKGFKFDTQLRLGNFPRKGYTLSESGMAYVM